jgi:peptidoglycan/LPS O-acetylase OafA/YrhL
MILVPAILFGQKYVWINHLLSTRPFVLTGKLSYSLYLFQQVAYTTVDSYITPYGRTPLHFCCGLAVVYTMALISFNVVEKPVMALRRKFGSHAGALLKNNLAG